MQGFPFFEVSSASGHAVRTLFATLFARILATVPGIPKDLSALAVQMVNTMREQDNMM
jgi:DnaJ family protein C protein 27